jgi:DNA-binding response OmpR family regulator
MWSGEPPTIETSTGTLPAQSEAIVNTNPRIAQRPGTTRRQPHILLAEDNKPMLRLLTELLCQAGCDVTPACDGLELAEELHEGQGTQFDAIVSDVHMPGCSGLQVLRGLRERDHLTPFVVITAFGDEVTHAQTRRLGGYVLDKPFDPQQLVSYLRCLLPRLRWLPEGDLRSRGGE